MRTRTVDGLCIRKEVTKPIIRKDTGKVCKPRDYYVCTCNYCGEKYLSYQKWSNNCGKRECLLKSKKIYSDKIKIRKFGELGYKKKECLVCGKVFKPKTSRAKYCSKECSLVVERKKKNESQKKYNFEKRKDVVYIFKKRLRRWIERCISGKKAKASREYVNYSPQEFKKHIERLFKEGMSWDNYGEWHVDHIRPLSSFDFLDKNGKILIDEVKKANSLSNLQPLWAKENLSKNDKWDGSNEN